MCFVNWTSGREPSEVVWSHRVEWRVVELPTLPRQKMKSKFRWQQFKNRIYAVSQKRPSEMDSWMPGALSLAGTTIVPGALCPVSSPGVTSLPSLFLETRCDNAAAEYGIHLYQFTVSVLIEMTRSHNLFIRELRYSSCMVIHARAHAAVIPSSIIPSYGKMERISSNPHRIRRWVECSFCLSSVQFSLPVLVSL